MSSVSPSRTWTVVAADGGCSGPQSIRTPALAMASVAVRHSPIIVWALGRLRPGQRLIRPVQQEQVPHRDPPVIRGRRPGRLSPVVERPGPDRQRRPGCTVSPGQPSLPPVAQPSSSWTNIREPGRRDLLVVGRVACPSRRAESGVQRGLVGEVQLRHPVEGLLAAVERGVEPPGLGALQTRDLRSPAACARRDSAVQTRPGRRAGCTGLRVSLSCPARYRPLTSHDTPGAARRADWGPWRLIPPRAARVTAGWCAPAAPASIPAGRSWRRRPAGQPGSPRWRG